MPGNHGKPCPAFKASGATPKVAVGPRGGNSDAQSLWVTLNRRIVQGGGLICSGTEIRGLGSTNILANWSSPEVLPNSTAREITFSNMAIGPQGAVMVCHIIGTGSLRQDAPVTCYTSVDPDGLGGNGFASRDSFQINMGWEYLPAQGFEAVPIPVVAWDRLRDRAYVAYPGKETLSGEGNDNSEIYVRYSTNAGVSWSDRIKVNDDETERSQFHPWLALDQESGNVAVAWYDARMDPKNEKVHFFGADSTNQFATPEPGNFQVSTGESKTTPASGDFKEYIGLTYYRGWVYPVWMDNSNSTGDNPDGALDDFDIYVSRLTR